VSAIPPDQLRQLVREVLADVVAKLPAQPPRPSGQPGTLGEGQWTVRISTDEDLHAFTLRVLKLAGNPKLRQDLISGRARFRLAGGTAGPAVPAAVHLLGDEPHGSPARHRVEKGAVTERAVAAAAAAGARLVLGPRAVLTPLAKDKARALGVVIERPRGGWSDARAPGSTERPRGGWSDARAP
jgi:hypothetical protein